MLNIRESFSCRYRKPPSPLSPLMLDRVSVPASPCWGEILRGQELKCQNRWGSVFSYFFSAKMLSHRSSLWRVSPHPTGKSANLVEHLTNPTASCTSQQICQLESMPSGPYSAWWNHGHWRLLQRICDWNHLETEHSSHTSSGLVISWTITHFQSLQQALAGDRIIQRNGLFDMPFLIGLIWS